MHALVLSVLFIGLAQAPSTAPGNYTRTITHDNLQRSYSYHVPKNYDPTKATPIVLALHGASMNGAIMALFTGLNDKSDEANFIVVYPNGTGLPLLMTWNAGAFPGALSQTHPDDVAFIGKVLDDIAKIVNVDQKRIFATGMSNGAMMAHRLGAEMSDRIAAIAPVAGTLALDKIELKRPVPVIQFHGTLDPLVAYDGPKAVTLKFKSVEDTMLTWAKANGCAGEPKVTQLPQSRDNLQVIRKDFGVGRNGGEVVLYTVEGGGHTWPGMDRGPAILGRSTSNIIANDVMWQFFSKHPMP